MSKSKKTKLQKTINPQQASAVDLQRGTINSCFVAALVTSPVYKMQIVKAKKGKGSFKRSDKHKNRGQESYLIAA